MLAYICSCRYNSRSLADLEAGRLSPRLASSARLVQCIPTDPSQTSPRVGAPCFSAHLPRRRASPSGASHAHGITCTHITRACRPCQAGHTLRRVYTCHACGAAAAGAARDRGGGGHLCTARGHHARHAEHLGRDRAHGASQLGACVLLAWLAPEPGMHACMCVWSPCSVPCAMLGRGRAACAMPCHAMPR